MADLERQMDLVEDVLAEVIAEEQAYQSAIIPEPPVSGADLYEANAWHAATTGEES